jgi:purine-binding chemotaxis protein CheW
MNNITAEKILTREQAKSEEVQNLEQFLTFTIGEEEYGIDIMTVREIKAYTNPTRLPNTPSYLLGVLNLRGAIIPILDVKNLFGLDSTEKSENKVIIFLTIDQKTVGILVDTVSDIINFNKADIKPAPRMEEGLKDEFLDGLVTIGERMVVLLNIKKLIEESNNYNSEQ